MYTHTGFSGARGYFLIPTTATLTRWNPGDDGNPDTENPYPTRSPDAICLMLGVRNNRPANSMHSLVEAGPYYYSRGNGSDEWVPFMLFWYRGATGRLIGHLNRWEEWTTGIIPGQRIYVECIAFAGPSSRRIAPAAICIIHPESDNPRTLATFGNFRMNDSLSAKRMMSIAQPDYNQTVRDTGYSRSGSFFQYSEFTQGELFPVVGPPGLWTAGNTNLQGSFPLNSAIVSWFVAGAYYSEWQIRIDLRP